MLDVVASAEVVDTLFQALPLLHCTLKPVSSDELSVQARAAAVAEVAVATSPVGAGGGMVSETASLEADPCAFVAVTRKSNAVLATSPRAAAVTTSAATDPATVQALSADTLYSTSKPPSLSELSVQDRSTVVEPVADAARPEGAAGPLGVVYETMLLGLDSPFALISRMRKSLCSPGVRSTIDCDVLGRPKDSLPTEPRLNHGWLPMRFSILMWVKSSNSIRQRRNTLFTVGKSTVKVSSSGGGGGDVFSIW